jgi:alkylhydroperoxidase family enzyme
MHEIDQELIMNGDMVIDEPNEAGPIVQTARVWAMPAADTFDCQPIGDMVRRYLRQSKVSIDPFARNKRWATYTNDLNPNTAAQYHMDAYDFLCLLRDSEVVADLIIFDPPYSLRQAKEVYEQFGEWKFDHTQNAIGWLKEKAVCYDLLAAGGHFLHFGWHTNGLGKKNGAVVVELLVVAHGRAHNDTLCLAERKMAHQTSMEFAKEASDETHNG